MQHTAGACAGPALARGRQLLVCPTAVGVSSNMPAGCRHPSACSSWHRPCSSPAPGGEPPPATSSCPSAARCREREDTREGGWDTCLGPITVYCAMNSIMGQSTRAAGNHGCAHLMPSLWLQKWRISARSRTSTTKCTCGDAQCCQEGRTSAACKHAMQLSWHIPGFAAPSTRCDHSRHSAASTPPHAPAPPASMRQTG